MNDKFVKGTICLEYCHRECKACGNAPDECTECADNYVMNGEGKCVIESQFLGIFVKIRAFLNVIKRRGLKSAFLALDDLWLYSYHKN